MEKSKRCVICNGINFEDKPLVDKVCQACRMGLAWLQQFEVQVMSYLVDKKRVM